MHGSFYVMTKPDVHKKLTEELHEARPDLKQPTALAALEKLPYLASCSCRIVGER